MKKIENVVFVVEKNMIECLVDGVKYELVFDGGESLCEVIIDDVSDSDYDEDLINDIILMSM